MRPRYLNGVELATACGHAWDRIENLGGGAALCRDCGDARTGVVNDAAPVAELELLTAVRLMAQSDRSVAEALRVAEAAIKLLVDTSQEPGASPERALAAGMALAVVQHTASSRAQRPRAGTSRDISTKELKSAT